MVNAAGYVLAALGLLLLVSHALVSLLTRRYYGRWIELPRSRFHG